MASCNRSSRGRFESITLQLPHSMPRASSVEWEGSSMKEFALHPASVVVSAMILSSLNWTGINLAFLAWLLLAFFSSSPSITIGRIIHVLSSTGLFTLAMLQTMIMACGRWGSSVMAAGDLLLMSLMWTQSFAVHIYCLSMGTAVFQSNLVTLMHWMLTSHFSWTIMLIIMSMNL